MKTKLFTLLFLGFFSLSTRAQSVTATAVDNTYAIVQVTSPQSVFGEYTIKIAYGNGKVEDFKTVDFTRKNNNELINEITNVLNYMSKKGYTLMHTLTYALPGPNMQYIMEKK